MRTGVMCRIYLPVCEQKQKQLEEDEALDFEFDVIALSENGLKIMTMIITLQMVLTIFFVNIGPH